MAAPPKDQLELSVTRYDRRTESRRLMQRLRVDAGRIAAHFGLDFKAIRAERPGVHGHYGVCYADGEIRIRLRHAVTGKPLRYSSLMDTLCHELAHLRYFDHGEQFWTLFEHMLEWSRAEGLYRPRRVDAASEQPVQQQASSELQLPLFGDPRLRGLLARRPLD